MTGYVLVPGHFTGAWVWQEVAERLRAAGAAAYPVTLSGMGEQRPAPAQGSALDLDPASVSVSVSVSVSGEVGLETHIAELVGLIDRAPESELVLVAHDYAIHPVLGAADRRPGRVRRVVHLDAGMPKDGDRASALLPDAGLRALVEQPDSPDRPGSGAGVGVGVEGGAAVLPAPGTVAEWGGLGATEGLSAAQVGELVRRAAPQPLATLTEPLRLTGAGAQVPTTGVFCTANGITIAMVEAMVRMGHPDFVRLVDHQVTFFELPTGHWPMLSAPAELAAALLAAGAGEGHRISAAPADQLPPHLRPFAFPVPEVRRERLAHPEVRLDLHLPERLPAAGEPPLPAVLYVHGGPVPAGVEPTPRDWPDFVGQARYLASLGVIGAVVDHGLHGLTDYPQAAEDVAAAVELLRADPRVDSERIALWFFSGGSLLSARWLAEPPSWLRVVALTYPVLAPLPSWGMVDRRYRPVEALPGAGELPIVLTTVELEQPELAGTVDKFRAAAAENGSRVELVEVPGGHHGFETLDGPELVRWAVDTSVQAVLRHLRG
ncbi:alpha/beta hydrolase [Kitasatospora sp. MMS16-BH015]|uniref:alpha/beta hydrolase n=1 Tax=Kitasatospora sp. MMS16-BH015 TaxID=2018025 RepID=UPI000CF252B6|nr:alpha/beta hydrolase [Kitasatospora sp. MMS16-BH015]